MSREAALPRRAETTDATPLATKALLLATLAATAVALVVFVAADERRGDSGFTAPFLLLFLLLFFARVIGQIAVVLARPSWLPPAAQWNLLPYRILLPVQLAILALLAAIVAAFAAGNGPFVEPRERVGAGLVWFSFAYAGAMPIRYAVRMWRRPGERWFGGTIPMVFHVVLAAFLFVLGSYHVAA